MGHSIPIPNGILHLASVDFKCPACGEQYREKDYNAQLSRSKNHLIYKTCKGEKCEEVLGITFDIKSDVVVWLKKDEKGSDLLK
jgi:predicted RNA-binding Zn-ribbon protein involved in translation (DUF1610 family)